MSSFWRPHESDTESHEIQEKSRELFQFSWEKKASHEKNEILMSEKPHEKFSSDFENSHEKVIFSWESHEILMRKQKLTRIFVRVVHDDKLGDHGAGWRYFSFSRQRALWPWVYGLSWAKGSCVQRALCIVERTLVVLPTGHGALQVLPRFMDRLRRVREPSPRTLIVPPLIALMGDQASRVEAGRGYPAFVWRRRDWEIHSS